MNDIVKLAIDAHQGNAPREYSFSDTMDILRQELIKVNNGKDHIDLRDIRDGRCAGLFTIIEEIIDKEVVEGLRGDEFFMNMVDYRNLAEDDKNEFYIPDKSLLAISEIAEGSQAIRRQRLNGGETITIPTTVKGIKIYDELTRVLSGRLNMNDMIDRVSVSLVKNTRETIFKVFSGLTQADMLDGVYYPAAGTYNEDVLLTLIDHVEAATGKSATIIGTKSALRKLKGDVDMASEKAKEDLYNLGYYGRFNGTNVLKINQVHKVGSTDFMLDNNKLYIIASDEKPIKYVTEGQTYIAQSSMLDNADMTQEYMLIEQTGIGWVAADALGIYEMA